MNINEKLRRCLIAVNLFVFSALVQSATFDMLQGQDEVNGYENNGAVQQWNFGLTPDILDSVGSKYNETYVLIKEKKLQRAKIKLGGLLEGSPKDPKLLILQGMIFTLEKKNDEAIQSYKKAIEYEKSYYIPYAGLAKLYLAKGSYESAEWYSKKVLEINKKFIPSYLILSEIAEKIGDSVQASQYLRSAYQNSYSNKKLQIYLATILGKLYLKQNIPKKELELAEELVKIYPDDITAKIFLVDALVSNNKGGLAEKVLVDIVHKDKKSIKYRLILAKLMMRQSEPSYKVIPILDEVIRMKPESEFFLDIKGTYLRKQKQYNKALDVAKEAQKKFPESALGYRLEADVLKTQDKLEKAIFSYTKAFEIKASDKLLFIISDLYIKLNRVDQAISLLTKHVNKRGANQSIQFKLALVFQQQGKIQVAKKSYEKILKIEPDNLPVLNNLAWLYAQQDNPRALVLIEKAYNLAPKSATIVDTYGFVLTKQGEAKKAVEIMEKAVKLSPGSNQIQFHLAESYVANNNEVKAIKILEKLIASKKVFSEKKAATTLLSSIKNK